MKAKFDIGYFEQIAESFRMGNIIGAQDLFLNMPRIDRKRMIKAICGNWGTTIKGTQLHILIDLI